MKTHPNISFDEHIKEWLEFQRKRVPQLTKEMLKFCNIEDVVQIDEREAIEKKKLMDVKEFEVFFEKLCREGREWVNIAGESWYRDNYIVSVEYSTRKGFPVTAVLCSGPSLDISGKPRTKTRFQILEQS